MDRSRLLHIEAHSAAELRVGHEEARACLAWRSERIVLGLDEGKASQRGINWVTSLHESEAFWLRERRPPRRDRRVAEPVPADELRLGDWAQTQRRHWDARSAFQRVRLEVSPGFDRYPADARWIREAAAFENCLRSGLTPSERQRRWAMRQLKAMNGGKFSPETAAAFADLLALWANGGRFR